MIPGGPWVGEVRKDPNRPFVVAIRGLTNSELAWTVFDGQRLPSPVFEYQVRSWEPAGTVPGTPADTASGAADDRALADAVMRQWLRDGAVVVTEVDRLCEARAKQQGEIPLTVEDEL